MRCAKCDGCVHYEVARTVTEPYEYEHRCWRDPKPVVRLSWSPAEVVRACAHRDTGRR